MLAASAPLQSSDTGAGEGRCRTDTAPAAGCAGPSGEVSPTTFEHRLSFPASSLARSQYQQVTPGAAAGSVTLWPAPAVSGAGAPRRVVPAPRLPIAGLKVVSRSS